jgi:hypothetical protein
VETLKVVSTVLVVLALFASLFSFIQPVYSQGENYVIIEPSEPSTAGVSPYAIAPEQMVSVNVTIKNAVNVYGYNLTFYWDNLNIVEYVDYYFHPFLEEPYTSTITRLGNKVTVYAKSQSPANPVNGSGVLVTIFYKGKETGESLIRFDAANCYLISQDGSQFYPSTFKRGKLVVTNTKIVVEPETLSGEVNETVKANITVYNVVNLYGIEFNVTWDPTVLTLTKVNYQVPWSAKFEARNQTGIGYYSLAVSGIYPATSYTGNFTFTNLEFNVTQTGFSPITFAYSKLGDSTSKPIAHVIVNAIFSNVKTLISFDPAIITDTSKSPGYSFSVNLTISEAVNLKDFKIRISYSNILNVSSITFNEIFLTEANSTIDEVTRIFEVTGSFREEYIGDYMLATIEFTVANFGYAKVTVITSQSYLKNGEGSLQLFNTYPFTFANWRNVGVRQITLKSEVMFGAKFVIGQTVNVSVLIENIGASAENVNLTVSYQADVTVEGNLTSFSEIIYEKTLFLEKYGEPNSITLETFTWNTTGLYAGNYYITANVTAEVDHDLTDNSLSKAIELISGEEEQDTIPPEISEPWQDPPANNVQPLQNVTVRVNVTDYGSGIKNVTLWYSTDNGTSWTIRNMTALPILSDTWITYEATIDGYENCTWVTYKIIAYDNAENNATKDNNGYGYQYHVIPEYPSTLILVFIMATTLITTSILKIKKRRQLLWNSSLFLQLYSISHR